MTLRKNLYDSEHIRNWYDNYAEQETLRWEQSIVEKVKYEVHLQMLKDNISKGEKVLEIGAGTGMFTRELAKITSEIVVSDLSPVQLALNQKRAEEEHYQDKIEKWQMADITDLSEFEDASFDKILCFGGPLSYVFEKKLTALSEMKRVLRPEGLALLSVMNFWGTIHQHMHAVMHEIPKEKAKRFFETGDMHASTISYSGHQCHLFTLDELTKDCSEAGFEIYSISASNCLSFSNAKMLGAVQNDQEKWNYFMELEKAACKSTGMLESGTHIIFALKKR